MSRDHTLFRLLLGREIVSSCHENSTMPSIYSAKMSIFFETSLTHSGHIVVEIRVCTCRSLSHDKMSLRGHFCISLLQDYR